MIDGYIEVPEEETLSCLGCDFYRPDKPEICTLLCCTDCSDNNIIYKRKEKTMTKADLKTGMRVEYRGESNHEIVIVLRDYETQHYGLGALSGLSGSLMDIGGYADDLTYPHNSRYDIMAIYAPVNDGSILRNIKGKLLWQRSVPEEMIDLDEMGEVSKSTIKEALKAKFNREA